MGFPVLHPPFLYPQPISESLQPYLLYPFIEGQVLADELYERPEIIEKVLETTGRVQTTMRSLILVPFYQETLRSKEQLTQSDSPPPHRMPLDHLQQLDDLKKQARHREMAESLLWTESRFRDIGEVLLAQDLLPHHRLEQYQMLLNDNFSLHLPIFGTSLSHISMKPEHLLLCPDGQMGVLSWQIASRPRFYMNYTYLAWCFVHSKLSDPMDFYRVILARLSNKVFTEEHHLVFCLCLLEQLAEVIEKKSGNGFQPSERRITEISSLFLECLDIASKINGENA